jgi:hypothetical protein
VPARGPAPNSPSCAGRSSAGPRRRHGPPSGARGGGGAPARRWGWEAPDQDRAWLGGQWHKAAHLIYSQSSR